MKKNGFLHSLRYMITFLAILNLILLFGFHYEIPTAMKDKLLHKNNQKENLYAEKDKEEQPEELAVLNITLETDTLEYDGSSALDLLSGVTVTDKNGDTLDLDIYSSIQSTDDANTKIITYSVRDEEGNEAAANRKLILNHYSGPSITIGQPYPEILDVELDHILETFLSDNLLNANDGYGKNITNAIKCSYKIADRKATRVDVTFTITNHFDDKVTKTTTIPISRTKPLIVLNTTSVTIKKGEPIDPRSYIESASNEEGDDLISRIEIEGDVNTAVAGSYTITYTLTDRDRESADPVMVKVTVEE